MKKFAIAGIAALAIAGSTAVYAQHNRSWSHHHERMNPEDRAAFTDARIAAVKAGLKLKVSILARGHVYKVHRHTRLTARGILAAGIDQDPWTVSLLPALGHIDMVQPCFAKDPQQIFFA